MLEDPNSFRLCFFYDAVNAEMLLLHSLFTLLLFFILKILLDDRLSSEECLRWNWIKLKLNWRKLRKSLQHFFHLSLVRLVVAFSADHRNSLYIQRRVFHWVRREEVFFQHFLLLPHDNFIHFLTICSAERNLRQKHRGLCWWWSFDVLCRQWRSSDGMGKKRNKERWMNEKWR